MAVEQELEEALTAVQLGPEDGAAVELARTYARSVDLGDDLAKVGPALLAVLAALGMTPVARAALAKAGAAPAAEAPRSPLDELRARRKAREATP